MLENENVETTNLDTDTSQDYINVINDLKANSVPTSDYLKLREENKQLLQALKEGKTIESEPEQPKASADELRTKLFGDEELTNLEYWSTALELRDRIIENGGEDPFVGKGSKIAPSGEDYDKAETVANTIKGWVEEANGNPETFQLIMQSRTVDTAPMMMRYKKHY